jgi:chorismate mutase
MPDWSALQDCRTRLDQVDQEIMRLFGERYAIRREVKAIKQRAELPVQDPSRVKVVVDQAVAHAAQYNVPADFAQALYELVIDYSHKFEE